MTRTHIFAPALLALGLTALAFAPHSAHAQAAQKPVLTTLHRFDGAHGAYPEALLTQGGDGNYYGDTFLGGITEGDYFPGREGYGTIFKMMPDGTFQTLFRFNNVNGALPSSALVSGPDGAFYGVTSRGSLDGKGSPGNGTFFKITSSGALDTLYKFGGFAHGANPASLMLAKDGLFYGTTVNGGTSSGGGFGTVFRMTSFGSLSVLHSFDLTEGAFPFGRLTQGADGALYGVTINGGKYRRGVVFRLGLDGAYSVLHHFSSTDGSQPYAGLTLGADGSFYGTTARGGHKDVGTIFRITPGGKFTTLYAFSQDGHGFYPEAPLALGPDGNFYGTTYYSNKDEGNVFRMTPDGQLTTLYRFVFGADGKTLPHGANPLGGVMFGADGALYGTTANGDAAATAHGTIFKLSLPR